MDDSLRPGESTQPRPKGRNEEGQASENVIISRPDRRVAASSGSRPPGKPVNGHALRALSERLPACKDDAGVLLRRLRDAARY